MAVDISISFNRFIPDVISLTELDKLLNLSKADTSAFLIKSSCFTIGLRLKFSNPDISVLLNLEAVFKNDLAAKSIVLICPDSNLKISVLKAESISRMTLLISLRLSCALLVLIFPNLSIILVTLLIDLLFVAILTIILV